MDAELNERILECLRGLEIGESISADGIADEIGGKLSDVYDALEDLENAKLVEMHPACRKGSDPTYTLTPKGRRYLQHDAKTPEPETIVEERADPEPRPSADRVCRFCGKIMEPNKVRRHENLCGKNPDSVANSRMRKATKEESIVTNATANIEPEPVPDPAEYAEESNVAHVLDFEVPLEGHITQAGGTDFPAMPDDDLDNGDLLATIEQIAAGCPDLPDEVPPAEVPPLEEVARIAKCDMLVLKGSPGMDAALRLISYCQRMVNDGADLSLESSVKIADGFYISVSLDIPKRESDE